MSSAISGVDLLLIIVRYTLLALAALFALLCLLDWAVRTRRVNLFGGVARFSRAKIDPFLAPIERRVVAAGGLPTSAPLWALAAVVVGGILLISLLNFIYDELYRVSFAID